MELFIIKLGAVILIPLLIWTGLLSRFSGDNTIPRGCVRDQRKTQRGHANKDKDVA